jgi:hypothetical protein
MIPAPLNGPPLYIPFTTPQLVTLSRLLYRHELPDDLSSAYQEGCLIFETSPYMYRDIVPVHAPLRPDMLAAIQTTPYSSKLDPLPGQEHIPACCFAISPHYVAEAIWQGRSGQERIHARRSAEHWQIEYSGPDKLRHHPYGRAVCKANPSWRPEVTLKVLLTEAASSLTQNKKPLVASWLRSLRSADYPRISLENVKFYRFRATVLHVLQQMNANDLIQALKNMRGEPL